MDLKGVVPLDENSLLATAKANTGLSDFGSDDWHEPFQVLVKALDTEAELHLIGRLMARGELLMFLAGRLWIEDTYKQHPDIEDQQIIKPLMIMGQGRSGTTGMHHLLASDPANRAPMTWEVLLPYPPPEKATFASDPRIEQAVKRFNLWNRVTPEIVAMHDFSGDLATENIHIQCLCFQSPLWLNMLGQIPSYNAYMEKRSLVPAYEYEKRVLKYLQWKNPGDRWVHKTPAYTDTMPAALKVFPDAQFIWMHRDPVKALASMVSTAGTINWARSDRAFIGGDVQGQFGDLESFTSAQVSAARLNAAIDRIEAGLPPQQQLCNVQYLDFVKDPQAVAAEIVASGGSAIADDHSVDEPDAGRAMVQAALDAFGRIDIVLCNAGITILEPFDQLDLQNFRKVVDVNLWGTVNVVHAAWPTMVKQRYGRIVLTTSTGGLYGVPSSTPYSTSKASLIGFARALTFDVPAGADIKINVLAPSAATKMLKGWVSDEMAAVLRPDRVATTAGWLASKACDRNGIILFAAAGRVTRVRIVESEPVEIIDDDFTVDWSTLDSTQQLSEASGVFESLAKLLPSA